jgi:hypothetical protein
MGHIIPAGTGFGQHRTLNLKPMVELDESTIEEEVIAEDQEPVAG